MREERSLATSDAISNGQVRRKKGIKCSINWVLSGVSVQCLSKRENSRRFLTQHSSVFWVKHDIGCQIDDGCSTSRAYVADLPFLL